MDEERLLNFKGRISRYEARLVQPYQNNKDKHKKFKKTRCKYCYRPGHTDPECRDNENKRPPSMPDWVSKIQYSKCKKTEHLTFNCPPKFINIKRKSPKENRYNKYNKYNNHKDKGGDGENKTETAAVATVEFAGFVTASNFMKHKHQHTHKNCRLPLDIDHLTRMHHQTTIGESKNNSNFHNNNNLSKSKNNTKNRERNFLNKKSTQRLGQELGWLTKKLHDHNYKKLYKIWDQNKRSPRIS